MSLKNIKANKKSKLETKFNLKRFFSKKSNKVFSIIATGVILFSAILGFGFWSVLNDNNKEARADGIIRKVAPGEQIQINYWYANVYGADQGDTKANLQIDLGNVFKIDRIYDVFDTSGDGDLENETEYDLCMDDIIQVGTIRRRFFYTPRSAEQVFQDSSAECAPGKTTNVLEPVVLPQAEQFPASSGKEGGINFGRVTVIATLRPDVFSVENAATGSNFTFGDDLQGDNNQWAYSIFRTQAGSADTTESKEGMRFQLVGHFVNPADVTNVVCKDEEGNDQILVGDTAVCTFQLDPLPEGQYYAIPTDFEVQISDADESVDYNSCRILDNNTPNVRIECDNIPTEGATPNPEAPVNLTSNGETEEVGTVDLYINLIPLDPTHLVDGGLIPGQTFAEATNLSCEDALANTTTNCTGTLPAGYTAPEDGVLKLNVEGQPQVECVFAENNVDFTCNNLPVGSEITTAGNLKDIQAAIDDSEPVNTGEQINISLNPITPENLVDGGLIPGQTFAEATGLECVSSLGEDVIYATDYVDCSGQLPEGYGAPEGYLELNVEGQDGVICVFDGPNFTCNNMPAGDQVGQDIPIQASINESTPTDTGETIDVEELPPAPKVIVTEINWAGSSASNQDQWIELKNIGDTEVSLNNFIIKGIGNNAQPDIKIGGNDEANFSSGLYNEVDKSFNTLNNSVGQCLNKTIAPGQYFLISASRNTFANTLINVQIDCYFNSQADMDIDRNGQIIAIYSNRNILLDKVEF